MKSLFKKYRFVILFTLSLVVMLTLLLIFLSSGPQQGAFMYQVQ